MVHSLALVSLQSQIRCRRIKNIHYPPFFSSHIITSSLVAFKINEVFSSDKKFWGKVQFSLSSSTCKFKLWPLTFCAASSYHRPLLNLPQLTALMILSRMLLNLTPQSLCVLLPIWFSQSPLPLVLLRDCFKWSIICPKTSLNPDDLHPQEKTSGTILYFVSQHADCVLSDCLILFHFPMFAAGRPTLCHQAAAGGDAHDVCSYQIQDGRC